MSDLDLAALTEAVADRLDKGDEVQLSGAWPGTSSFVDGPLSAIVRAVLEALPREWGMEWMNSDPDGLVLDHEWFSDRRAAHGYAYALLVPSRVVWRAVGPPIPAEDQP